MHRTFPWLVLLASLAGATFAQPVIDQEYARGWFLVCLTQPLARNAGGAVDLATGHPALDDKIFEHNVRRIDPVLTPSGRSPRSPSALVRSGLDRTYRFHVTPGVNVLDLVAEFAALPGVEYAEPDWVGQGGATVPNDPLFPQQYGFEQISDADVDATSSWDVTTGSPGIIIAVLDTGIDSNHPEFVGKILPGFDFANLDINPEDDQGHGTNVSSILTASSNNSIGVAGACWSCRLLPLKTLDAGNSGFYSWWADAMVFATDAGADLINMSSGGVSASATLLAGVQYAYDAGVVHISITHNDDSPFVRYPGFYAETITIGATDEFDQRATPFCYSAASGSNYGPQIDVVAPGELILGAALGGGYNSWCGTSQAAPLVAGLVGLMYTVNPSLGREEVRHLLAAGAEDEVGRRIEDVAGFDNHHGWGRVNMHRSLIATVASGSLRVDGKAATRVFHQAGNPQAGSFDFIRGDLSSLSENTQGVFLGATVCLENDSPDADTTGNEDIATPPPGFAFFYVDRFAAAPGPGSYGGSSQHRDREPVSGDCPICGNGVFETGEVCDGAQIGGQTCAGLGFDAGQLACNSSCNGFDTRHCSSCGNNVCELFGGEDCLSCASDCNGVQSGNPGSQYCCSNASGNNPVDCADPRCTASGNTCDSG